MHGSVNGLENLRNWEHARLIPKTLQATTPSGGRHIYLKKIPEMPISQNIGMIEGVDIKAHVNNYILVPPSSSSKGAYEWDMIHSPKDGSITEAPRPKIHCNISIYKPPFKIFFYYNNR